MCRKITSHWQPLFCKKMAAAASFSYKIDSGDLIFLQNWRRRPHFPTKLAAAASFSNKIGGKDLATLLAAVLTWSGYWHECCMFTRGVSDVGFPVFADTDAGMRILHFDIRGYRMRISIYFIILGL